MIVLNMVLSHNLKLSKILLPSLFLCVSSSFGCGFGRAFGCAFGCALSRGVALSCGGIVVRLHAGTHTHTMPVFFKYFFGVSHLAAFILNFSL
jgi:hypothetical protein